MRWLETRVPPPVVTLVVAGAMWAVARLTPRANVELPGMVGVGIAAALLGVLLEVIAAMTFRRACTTVNPLDPGAATSLVSGGVYRLTRNPIYLGDLLALIGWAAYLGSVIALVLTPAFVVYIDRFQIAPEERVLEDKFGEPYREYKSKVDRWI